MLAYIYIYILYQKLLSRLGADVGLPSFAVLSGRHPTPSHAVLGRRLRADHAPGDASRRARRLCHRNAGPEAIHRSNRLRAVASSGRAGTRRPRTEWAPRGPRDSDALSNAEASATPRHAIEAASLREREARAPEKRRPVAFAKIVSCFADIIEFP